MNGKFLNLRKWLKADPDKVYLLEERAAIKEFHGGMSREEAAAAVEDYKKMLKDFKEERPK
jgi:uncharacterized circularly permuted ATP-grasp superfamily protein